MTIRGRETTKEEAAKIKAGRWTFHLDGIVSQEMARINQSRHRKEWLISLFIASSVSNLDRETSTRGPLQQRWSSILYLERSTTTEVRAMSSLVVRASDSRPEGLGSMPDATKYPPSTHGVRAR
ncbi:hypothetical protein TNCV_2538821 [Trichonephila clavipes]|nr:hypothetical protein TNCV_2538821 [Trichonephila clavipes]